MSTELQSAKYLSPEYFENAYAAPEQASPAPLPPGTVALISGGPAAVRWTGGLTFVVILCGLLGISGVLGGLNGLLSLGTEDNADVLREVYAQSPAHGQMMRQVLDAQSENKPVILFSIGLRVLVGLGFLVGCGSLYRRRPNANSFVVMVCATAIFYNLTSIVVAWLVMPSIAELPGVSNDAAGVAQGVVVGTICFVAVLKTGIYATVMAYLSRANIKALFAPPDAIENPMAETTAATAPTA